MQRMMYLLRHLAALLALPTMVLVVVPAWIVTRYCVHISSPASVTEWLLAGSAVVLFVPGLALFCASVHHFFAYGRGTLAPWDPPRRLVVRGPYRYVRNPMISGVMLMLCGLALGLRSWPHGIWAALFVLGNAVYIPAIEEPSLERRFGAAYREYGEHVGRFLPRARPWSGGVRPDASGESVEDDHAR